VLLVDHQHEEAELTRGCSACSELSHLASNHPGSIPFYYNDILRQRPFSPVRPVVAPVLLPNHLLREADADPRVVQLARVLAHLLPGAQRGRRVEELHERVRPVRERPHLVDLAQPAEDAPQDHLIDVGVGGEADPEAGAGLVEVVRVSSELYEGETTCQTKQLSW
jgi:hypothetical protein